MLRLGGGEMLNPLDAILETWNRNTNVVLNILKALPEGGIDARDTNGQWTIAHHLADMQILVISGLAKEAIAYRGGLPLHAHLLQKPINFDWLQGYVTALVTANIQWHSRKYPVLKDVLQPASLESPGKIFKQDNGADDASA